MAELVPGGGLRRGTITSVGGTFGDGVTSLSLALIARVTQSPAAPMVVIVGGADYGWEAAVLAGVDLARIALVPDAGPRWPEVVAAVVEELEVCLLVEPRPVRGRDALRVAARVKERDAVLIVQGDWPQPHLRLMARGVRWRADGTRRVGMAVDGRGAAERPSGLAP